jgi:hypothetical protein
LRNAITGFEGCSGVAVKGEGGDSFSEEVCDKVDQVLRNLSSSEIVTKAGVVDVGEGLGDVQEEG